ncbi:MAG: D-alanyl-D-alanine carboxypeptidase family protein [Aestuariivirga sp.]
MVELKLRVFSAVLAMSMACTPVAAFARPEFSSITVDARDGHILFADHADGLRHPASLTKMLTLYILFQEMKAGKFNRDSRLKVSVHAASMAPTKLDLEPGSTISVDEAIKAIITKSANDAAVTIAENVGGSESAFAARMTTVAHSIGMTRSHFNNASGLPNSGQYTTARDIATLGLRLMRDFPQYYPYFRTTEFQFQGRTIKTHNMLTLHYPGTDGFKTGYVAASGFNLATSTKRGDKRLVGVVLGSRSPAIRSRYMIHMLDGQFAKAKDGNTIAALAGSSAGAINPIEVTDKDKPAVMNNLGLAAAAVDASTADSKVADATDKSAPKVMDAQLDPVDIARKAEKIPFAVVSANDKPGDIAKGYGDSWNVQVGTYAGKPSAEVQLDSSRKKFAAQFEGKPGFTMQDDKDGSVVYRARFAGFTADTAAKACLALKEDGASCLMIAPEG